MCLCSRMDVPMPRTVARLRHSRQEVMVVLEALEVLEVLALEALVGLVGLALVACLGSIQCLDRM